jgi:hypothetical protein
MERPGQRPIDVMNRRRAQETLVEENKKRIANINKVTSRAQWENDTDKVIAKRRAGEAAAKMEAQNQMDLYERRQKLANLYNSEMNAWQNEVSSNVETADDRKNKIRARAKTLYDARKAQESGFVSTQRARQWRDASDDLRSLDTHATLMDVAERRREQLFEKNRQQAQQIEDEQQWSLAWEQDRLQKEAREEMDSAKRSVMNKEMRRDLDLQRQQRAYRADCMKNKEDDEAGMTKERWRQEKVLQEEHDQKVKAAERARGRAVLEYNNARQMNRAEDAKLEMQNDLVLLQVALEKERRELEEEEEKKRQEKEMTKQFQEHLRQQMVKEAQDDTLLEELRRQDEERTFKKKEAQYMKEQSARANLLALTVQGRKDQLAMKAMAQQQDREQDRLHAQSVQAECERLEILERQTAGQQAKARFDNQAAVRFQVSKKKSQTDKAKQDDYLQLRQMQYSEKNYQKMLSAHQNQVRNM